jgi:DNA-directed RNA polymerase specialized sigma24 family protein
MKKEWVLTQTDFDTLLNWLDPADRERAGSKYETIRLRLIKIFACRGCAEPEELADETINRVTAKVPEIANNYVGDPALYFYGVSQKVRLEYTRASQKRQAEGPEDLKVSPRSWAMPDTDDDAEPAYQCLEKCLKELTEENRKLVVEYYQLEKHAKIEHRKKLANEMGIAVNALRIRAHRIRVALQQCVTQCLDQQPAN